MCGWGAGGRLLGGGKRGGSRAGRGIWGTRPLEERVMRRAPKPRPQSALRMVRAAMGAS